MAADINTVLVYPAIFLGGVGMVAAFWLTQSMRRSEDVLDVGPMSWPQRTGAICLTAVVPLLCGCLSLLAIVVFQQVPGPWSYGALGTSGGVAAAVSQVVVPTLGGPLLGVALGRWVRFPGAAAVLLLVAYGWVTLTCTVTATLATAHRNSTLVMMLRFFAPFAFFTNEDSPGRVETWRGSPWFFLGWQLCLCAVAVIVALLRGADPGLRTRLLRLLAGVHQGPFLGVPPTGKNVTVAAWTIDRFTDGKIAESRIIMDTLGRMQQLGVIPTPGPPPA